MAQKILGLEIEAHSIRGVLIEAAYRGFQLHSALQIPILPVEVEVDEGEEVDPETLGELALRRALDQLVEGLGVPPDAVITAMPGSRTASSILTLPFVDARRIEATLGFEVESLLPFDLDEVMYDHQILSRDGGQSRLLVGVTRLEELERFVETLSACSLDPRVVTLPGLGAFSLATAVLEAERDDDADSKAGSESEPRAGDEDASAVEPTLQEASPEEKEEEAEDAPDPGAVAYVDLGAHRTLVAVCADLLDRGGPTLSFHRSLDVGVGAIVPTLAARWGLEEEEVEDRLAGLELGDRSPASQDVIGILAPAVRQLRQTFHAVRVKERQALAGIRLVGEGSSIGGIGRWLERELGVPCRVVASLPGAPDLDPAFSQALGLALRGLQRGRGLLNLRKGDLAFHGDMGYLRGKIWRLASLAAMVAVLLAVHGWVRISTVRGQEAALDEALCTMTARVLGTCETDYNIALSKLQGGGTKAASIPTASALEVFSVATKEIAPEVGLEVREIEATLDRLRLSGVVDSFEGVEQVESALRGSNCIGEVRQGRVQKNRDDKVELTLDALYICGQGTEERG